MKIPVIELTIDHVQSKVFLDSGARLSYLLPSLTAGKTSTVTETDFYPGLGTFHTPVFSIESYIIEGVIGGESKKEIIGRLIRLNKLKQQ
jgi:hypothetical protein